MRVYLNFVFETQISEIGFPQINLPKGVDTKNNERYSSPIIFKIKKQ